MVVFSEPHRTVPDLFHSRGGKGGTGLALAQPVEEELTWHAFLEGRNCIRSSICYPPLSEGWLSARYSSTKAHPYDTEFVGVAWLGSAVSPSISAYRGSIFERNCPKIGVGGGLCVGCPLHRAAYLLFQS